MLEQAAKFASAQFSVLGESVLANLWATMERTELQIGRL